MIRKKTGFWTFIFSLIPGAGEMYLGFFKHGLTIMLALFLSCALSDLVTGIAVLIPIIWFYSFFHVHNLISMPDEEFYALEDSYLGNLLFVKNDSIQFVNSKNGSRIVGGLLVFVGCCSLWNVLRSVLYRVMDEAVYSEYVRPFLDNIPRFVIGVAIILLGIRLIAGKKKELLSNDAAQIQDKKVTDNQEDTHAS